MPKYTPIDAGSQRICAICKKPYQGASHGHGVGLPRAVYNAGQVSTPRPIVGTPPTKRRK